MKATASKTRRSAGNIVQAVIVTVAVIAILTPIVLGVLTVLQAFGVLPADLPLPAISRNYF